METRTEPAFEWVGGDPALDFNNTVSWYPEGLANERLTSYDALVEWARGAGLVSDPEPLLARARRHPAAAAAALAAALELRRVLHDVLSAAAHGRKPDPARLRAFNESLAEGLARLELGVGRSGFRWDWKGASADLGSPLWPVARAAALLLTSDERPLLKDCANANCGWLFVDRSRRGNRRWCAMSGCGNRAKARRFYQRSRARAGRPAATRSRGRRRPPA
ncbi:MAG TPA: ABATE domain-containing protein [Gemmatimonadota bacterium]|jgi:predicted RNA-binding Zn ribbon-like protein